MSDNFTLKLGSVDLSPYVRIGDGNQGFDPYDGDGFVDPQFGTSPLADGQPLISSDIQNRQMAWPLNLSSYSKDDVHRIIRSINNEIATNNVLRVEWRDAGATDSTFYDVAFARFDPEFNYRRSEQNWSMGTLRIWCAPPFGHTGTYRIAGTALSPSSVAFTVPVATLLGDAPAQVDVRVGCGTGFVPQHGRIGLVAALPHASYAFLTPAGSMVVPSGYAIASLSGASGAIGSQSIQVTAASSLQELPWFQANISPASVYAGGRHRVLALMRADAGDRSIVARMFDSSGAPLVGAATAVPSVSQWHLVDMGVLSVPSTPQVATISLLCLRTGNLNPTQVHLLVDDMIGQPGAEVNALVMVPEDNFQISIDSSKRSIHADTFGRFDFSSDVTPVNDSYDQNGNRLFLATSLPGSATAFNRSAAGAVVSTNQRAVVGVDTVAVADVIVEQRYGGAVAALITGKMEKVPTQPRAILAQYNAASSAASAGDRSVSLISVVNGATSLLASAGANGLNVSGVEYRCQGAQMTALLKYLASTVASVGYTGQAGIFPGVPLVGMWGGIGGGNLYAGRSTVVPSQAVAAGDVMRFAQDGVQVFTIGSAYQRDVSGKARGNPIKMAPSVAVAIGVLAIGADGGQASDILSAEVRVRERFMYAR